jgi:predicted peptidase
MHAFIARLATVALLGYALATPTMAQESKSGQQAKSFKGRITKKVETQYLLFLPQGYGTPKSKRWPLIFFLHGAGERGTNLTWVTKHGPPKLVRDQPDFPFILVSPQCPAGQRWDSDVLLGLLDDVLQRYRVDRRRVYLTGLSMGGYGAWNLGLAYPERFAALAPICGGGDPLALLLAEPRRVSALKSLPVWVFHGAKDPVVLLSESQRMVDALRQFGAREVEFTVYPEAGHDSWTETYASPRLYEWFLRHQRK